MNIEKEYIKELVYEYKKNMDRFNVDSENDYSEWFIKWVSEALYYIAVWEGWTMSDIKRYFNKIM